MIGAPSALTMRLRNIEIHYVLEKTDMLALREARRLISDIAEFYQRHSCPEEIADLLVFAGLRSDQNE